VTPGQSIKGNIMEHFTVENPAPNKFNVYGNYTDSKGKPARFLAMSTWSQERVDLWLTKFTIAPDGMLCQAAVRRVCPRKKRKASAKGSYDD
jgi:hypothetical protein